MKKLIYRKLLSDILKNFVVLLVSLALIVWIIQAVNFLDFISEDGHGLKVYFSYTLLSFPKIISRLFIIVLFISIFYSLLKYEDKNELIIFWMNGIKKSDFLNNIIKFSVILFGLLILFTTLITPHTQDKARSFIRDSKIDFFPSLIQGKKFVDTVANLTIYVEERSNKQFIMKNLLIKEQKKGSRYSKLILAKEGKLVKENNKNIFKLKDGKIINYNENDEITYFNFESFKFNLSNYETKTTTIPKIQEISTIKLLECFRNLNFLKIIDRNLFKFNCQKDSNKNISQELYKRIYLPMYIPLICLIASLLIFTSKENIHYNKYKLSIFILGFILIFTSEISIKYIGINFLLDKFLFFFPIILFLISYSSLTFIINYQKKIK
tara:strand:- start:490 stop:1632 length:1143 start_codon:yes stop_codon:yes gene_type:complete